MTQEQFNAMMDVWKASNQTNDCHDYSEAAREWAIKECLIFGNGTLIEGEANMAWYDTLTREEFMVFLYRFAVSINKA